MLAVVALALFLVGLVSSGEPDANLPHIVMMLVAGLPRLFAHHSNVSM